MTPLAVRLCPTSALRLSLLLAALAGAGCSESATDSHPVTVVTTIAQDDDPEFLALGPQSIFWMDASDLTDVGVRAVSRAGGHAQTLADQPSVAAAIAYADGQVYWTGDGLWSVPEGGGTAKLVTTGFGDGGFLAIDGQTVWGAYAGNGLVVVNVPATGGLGTEVYKGPLTTYLMDFALAPDRVLWTTWDAQAMLSTLWVLPRTGGTPLAIATSPSELTTVMTDAANAYWLQSGTLMQAIPLDGGAPVTLTSFPYPTAIAFDGGDFYWCDGASLLKTPAAGGPSVVVAADQRGIASIVMDETSIYWLQETITSGWEIRTTER